MAVEFSKRNQKTPFEIQLAAQDTRT